MKIMTVVGARPNFMKAAPILKAIAVHNRAASPAGAIRHVLVHTGQHYDANLSDAFFKDLELPRPDVSLQVGSASHAVQTAEIMSRFEPVLAAEQPDVLIVVGDVNSTVACALVAAKISYSAHGGRPVIAHVEAGLRSFDRTMPEEINRILTDQLADLLFVTEESAVRNLAREGLAPDTVHFVGNTMIDSLLASVERAGESGILESLGLRDNGATKRYALLTLHRPANVDRREAFTSILEGIQPLASQCPVVFPVHPRTRKQIAGHGLHDAALAGIRLIEPLGYLDFLCLMRHASLVVTDSGGVQEETTCLGVPCVTVRENTERPVTTEVGTNILAGVKAEGIRRAIERQLAPARPGSVPPLWDGQAAQRIVEVLVAKMRTV